MIDGGSVSMVCGKLLVWFDFLAVDYVASLVLCLVRMTLLVSRSVCWLVSSGRLAALFTYSAVADSGSGRKRMPPMYTIRKRLFACAPRARTPALPRPLGVAFDGGICHTGCGAGRGGGPAAEGVEGGPRRGAIRGLGARHP